MAWLKGPLPKDTFGWGGVVPINAEALGSGFYLCDFCGDYVQVVGCDGDFGPLLLMPNQVAYYDNSLTLPPDGETRAKGNKP